MSNVIPLSGQAARCSECRHAADCPVCDGTGVQGHSTPPSRTRVAHDGDRLYRAGQRVDAVYRVRSGTVKTSLTAPDGEEQVTGFYGPGEWLGLDAMDGGAHRSDAVALDTVSVCVIPFSALRDRFARSAHAARILLGAMSDRLSRKESMHLSLARDGAAQRLASFLCDLCARRESAGLDGDHITLPMSRGEIASYLALAVETVSRLLTRMQRAGVLEVHRHHVLILDRDALFAAAGVQRAPAANPPSSATRQ